MTVLLVILMLLLFWLLIYWQLIIAEGAYMGQWMVTWLYNRYATQYNGIKEFDAIDEQISIAHPLHTLLGEDFDGIMLDVATGTGRVPLAMTARPNFHGRLIGLDHAPHMLAVARNAMPAMPLVIASGTHLPFADNTFPAVTCLEALEFMPDPKQALKELVRVLQPHGILLTSNRVGWEARFMPKRAWSSHELFEILDELPLTNVAVEAWENIYDQVWARKI